MKNTLGDIFVTTTGNKNMIDLEHIKVMKDSAILANSGHFNVEINVQNHNSLAWPPGQAQLKNKGKLQPKVYKLPRKIDQKIAQFKLAAIGIEIDKLTSEQKKYLASWQEGT